jgi:hypothetical protein
VTLSLGFVVSSVGVAAGSKAFICGACPRFVAGDFLAFVDATAFFVATFGRASTLLGTGAFVPCAFCLSLANFA